MLIVKKVQLVTTEIVYKMPDHPTILQVFLKQFEDHAPVFPEVLKFLDFWNKNIDGKIFSVRLMAQTNKYRHAQGVWVLDSK